MQNFNFFQGQNLEKPQISRQGLDKCAFSRGSWKKSRVEYFHFLRKFQGQTLRNLEIQGFFKVKT